MTYIVPKSARADKDILSKVGRSRGGGRLTENKMSLDNI